MTTFRARRPGRAPPGGRVQLTAGSTAFSFGARRWTSTRRSSPAANTNCRAVAAGNVGTATSGSHQQCQPEPAAGAAVDPAIRTSASPGSLRRQPMGPFTERLRDSVDCSCRTRRSFRSQRRRPGHAATDLHEPHEHLRRGCCGLARLRHRRASRNLAFTTSAAAPFQATRGRSPTSKGVYRDPTATPHRANRPHVGAFAAGCSGSFGATGQPCRELPGQVPRVGRVEPRRGGGWSGTFEYVSAVAATAPRRRSPFRYRRRQRAVHQRARSVQPAGGDGPRRRRRPAVLRPRPDHLRHRGDYLMRTIISRDHVTQSAAFGDHPAFDSAADRDGNGSRRGVRHHRAAGKTRFLYESRLFYPNYARCGRHEPGSSSAPVVADYRLRRPTPGRRLLPR